MAALYFAAEGTCTNIEIFQLELALRRDKDVEYVQLSGEARDGALSHNGNLILSIRTVNKENIRLARNNARGMLIATSHSVVLTTLNEVLKRYGVARIS